MKKYKFLMILLLLIGVSCTSENNPVAEDPPAQLPDTSAVYRVTFNAVWSMQTHSQDFPSGAHFSSLVGMTHNAVAALFMEGEKASVGIKDVAERGLAANLISEIEAFVSDGSADTLITAGGIASSPGSTNKVFLIKPSHPFISLVSMIAPSPDWFIGVNSFNLVSNGDWIDDITINVGVYDSGTDSGQTFGSPNQATDPVMNVFMITEPPLGVGGMVAPMGTFRFERIQ